MILTLVTIWCDGKRTGEISLRAPDSEVRFRFFSLSADGLPDSIQPRASALELRCAGMVDIAEAAQVRLAAQAGRGGSAKIKSQG